MLKSFKKLLLTADIILLGHFHISIISDQIKKNKRYLLELMFLPDHPGRIILKLMHEDSYVFAYKY